MKGAIAGMIGIVTFISCKAIYKPQQNKHILHIGQVVFLVVFLSSFFIDRGNFSSILVRFAAYLPVLTLFMVNHLDLKRISGSLNKIFAILISISFSVYFLSLIGLEFPNLGLEAFHQYDFINYFYVYLDSINYGISFIGFTLEPGYLSLLLVCLLLLNEFDFKKKSTWLYTICLFFSLSLGGYLLGFVSFVLHNLITAGNWRRCMIFITCTMIILLVLVIGVLNYNGGDNIIAEEILNRLVFDEELGIVGNNRENQIAQEIIDSFFYSNDIWMGIGADRYNEAVDIQGFDACSWRLFIVVHGVIYTSVFFLLSVFYFFQTNTKKTAPFFVVYWLDFLQHGTLFSESMYLLILYMNMNLNHASWKCLKCSVKMV